jgi:hypothetical protein
MAFQFTARYALKFSSGKKNVAIVRQNTQSTNESDKNINGLPFGTDRFVPNTKMAFPTAAMPANKRVLRIRFMGIGSFGFTNLTVFV